MTDLAPIITAIAHVRDECEHIEKDGFNAFHKYKYVSEAALSGAIRPLLKTHGLVIIPSVALEPAPYIDEAGVTHMVMEFTLAHESGVVWPEKMRVFCSGNDRDSKGMHGDKGAYKANTGGYKYFLNRLFMVDTGDDPERDGAKTRARPKPATAHKQPNATKLANESQAKMLKAKSYRQAEELGSTNAYDGIHNYAAAIRKAAMTQLGFEKLEEVTFAAVTPMVNAIAATVLGADGKVVLPDGGAF